GRDHTNKVGGDDGAQDLRAYFFGFADKTQVDGRAAIGLVFEFARDDEIAVLARKADGAPAGGIDAAHDLLVDGAGQHHLDNFHGSGIGDAQTVDEARCDVELLEHGADLRPAAMHHHGIDARLFHQHDVLGEMFADAVLHGVAPYFTMMVLLSYFRMK